MSFPSDGTNHHNAIENEHNTKEYLQNHAHLIYMGAEEGKYTVISKGGTKNKADNIIECDAGKIIKYISDKHKKKGLGGSFDYTNSSEPINDLLKVEHEYVKEIKVVLDGVKENKFHGGCKLSIEDRDKLVESYRSQTEKASYECLINLTSDDIITLIKNHLIEKNKKMEMFITDGKENKRYTFPFMNHPIVKLIENGFTASIKVKVGKMSGSIVFSKDDKKEDVGLRIRIHTNNGVTALLNAGLVEDYAKGVLGKFGIKSKDELKKINTREARVIIGLLEEDKKKECLDLMDKKFKKRNSYSQFVLKFQQDKIKNLLTTMGVSAIEI